MEEFPPEIVAPLSVLSAFVVVSNTLVCFLVFSQRRMRNYTNGFVVSLALSDIMTGVTLFIQYNTELHHVSRLIVNIIYSFVFICGVANLCAVTYDRYLAVTRPFLYKTSIAKVFKISIPLIWVLSLLIAALPLAWEGHINMELLVHKVYIASYLIGFSLIPYVFILSANFCIFRLVRRCVKKERQLSISTYNSKGDSKNSRIARKMSSEAKIARVFALAAFMFVLSWFPTIFYTAAVALDKRESVPPAIYEMSPFTIVLGSAVNPVLYSFMKPDFRRALQKFFNCVETRSRSRSRRASSMGPSSLGENSSPLQQDVPALVPTSPEVFVEETNFGQPLIETVV